jgi:two-component system cell cycle response regulator CpdR
MHPTESRSALRDRGSQDAPSAAPARKRVLLAEDDMEMRQIVRQILESVGLEVFEVSSGVALLSRLADDGDFDLVVTDVRMPWMSGEHVAQMARVAGFEMPILVMTAFADEKLRRAVLGIRGAALLEKPFAMRDLVDRARGMLGLA